MGTVLDHDPSTVATPAGRPDSPEPPPALVARPDPDLPDPDPPDADAVALDLRSIQQMIQGAPRGDDVELLALSDAELIDQIAALETLGQAVSALQADRIRTFARAHTDTRVGIEGEALDPRRLENSIAAQVGSACRISPTRGRTRLRTARDLYAGLEHVRGQHAAGELSAEKTAAVVAATADLDPDERARVDHELADHDLPTLGFGRLRDLVSKVVADIAPEKFRARATAARTGRRVTLRPGEDGMSWLTAHLPLEQGAACLAALARAVKDRWADATAAVTRSRGQTMADTLVERLTGQATAEAVPVEIQALLPVEALIDPDTALPAIVPGLGPVPVERLLSHHRGGRLSLRRLITRSGVVIGGDSRQRTFTGVLADLVKVRDGHRCREPYCDAPIRHIDHIRRSGDGGVTELDNGRGTCEFHNYLREQPGWDVRTTDDGIRTTTPTGHTYTSPTPRAA